MEKKIICYDIDGTLTSDMLFVPLILSEHLNGILNDVSYTNILETLGAYKNGEIAYEDAVRILIEKHARGLERQDVAAVSDHATDFVGSHADLFRPFGRTIIGALKNDASQLAVTAEPQYVADAVCAFLGMDGAHGSVYEVSEGKFTGNIASSLANRKQKAELLHSYDVFASFGDSEGDIDMLANSRYAICIHPSLGLKEQAKKNAWSIFDGIDDDSDKILSVLRA